MLNLVDNTDRKSWQPINLTTLSDKQLADLNEKAGLEICDTYDDQLKELFLLQNPHFRFVKNYESELKNFKANHVADKDQKQLGSWFYFPWLRKVIHFLDEDLHLQLRTSRNVYLVTKEEQLLYYNSSVAILGLSVGSHAAITLAMTGGPKTIILADPDEISGSNLNRIRTGFQNINIPKTIAVARQIYEINPYSDVSIFQEGVNEENVKIIVEQGKVDVIVEEMDQPYFKLKVREVARESKIPVVMATDNGDNVFVDIERYDLSSKLQLLNGLAEDLSSEELRTLDPKKLPAVAAKIAGAEMATTRMQKSVLEVGKSIYSWPQLGTAANLSGSAIAYVARRVILKETNIVSGRYQVNLDAIFQSDYMDPRTMKNRVEETENFLKNLQNNG